MKSIITDLELIFASNSNEESSNVLENESGNSAPEQVNSNPVTTVQGRIWSGFRRRFTTVFEGPTGAPPTRNMVQWNEAHGTRYMVGAGGGGPAAWAAAAFGRGDNRKV